MLPPKSWRGGPTSRSGMAERPRLPRQVFWLGVVSLANDASSEMIYSLLPMFLTTVLGASASYLGAVEGAAEATGSVLKLVFGRLADRTGRRKPLTVVGYALSSVAKPIMGVATHIWMVLAVRVSD